MKLCHMITIWVHFIMQVQSFGEPSPKNFGAKKHKKLADFTLLPTLIANIFGTRQIYPKSERYAIESDSSRVRQNKSGELWSTIHKVVHVSLDPPKSTFSADYILAPKRCWPLKFLHALDIHQGLLTHTTNLVGGPPKNFKGCTVLYELIDVRFVSDSWLSCTIPLRG